jgi:hypothetical protein
MKARVPDILHVGGYGSVLNIEVMYVKLCKNVNYECEHWLRNMNMMAGEKMNKIHVINM